jgi:succinoglycan biosynthesis transport protein ExoP
VATLVVALRLPSFYISKTTILVDPQQVPSSYVPTTVSTSVLDRLSAIRQEVMSPTRLKRLMDKLKLFPEDRGKVNDEDLVRKMQASIDLQMADAGGQRLSAFNISYTARKPLDAARVANELASMIIEENLQARHTQFYGTAEFLESELEDTKKQLEQKESELGTVKAQNILDLPESKQFHLEALSNLRTQLQASEDRVNRDHQERVYLQSMMLTAHPTVDLDTGAAGGEASSPYQREIQKLETRLSELQARYGPNHPDVRRVKKDLADLSAKDAADKVAHPQQPPISADLVSAASRRNPVIEAQLNKLNEDIQEQTKIEAELQVQINAHAAKLEQEPAFEQRLASLMRDYDTLRTHYNSLLDKKLSAEMAAELDSSQKGERFVILDVAPVPDRAAGPNRLLIALAGLIGGFIGGICLAIVVEMADESVRSERQAAQILGKVVLTEIPYIRTKEQLRWKRMVAVGAVVGAIVFSAGLGLLISFLAGRVS